jgi:hypothetical protein
MIAIAETHVIKTRGGEEEERRVRRELISQHGPRKRQKDHPSNSYYKYMFFSR